MTMHSARQHETGFTLLEMVAVASIFAMIVGTGIPIAELFIRQSMLADTREEMQELADAIMSYYGDVEAFPTALVDLVDPEVTPVGWMGPYVDAGFSDEEANNDSYRHDIWLTAYELATVSTTQRQLISYGRNRTDDSGGSDDIVINIDVGPQLGAITRRELLIINNAIATYNADFVYANPLSTTYATLLAQLQAAGYMPSDAVSTTRYLSDAWGQTYTTNGQTPVIEAISAGAP